MIPDSPGAIRRKVDISRFDLDRARGSTFVPPFAGGGSVSLRLQDGVALFGDRTARYFLDEFPEVAAQITPCLETEIAEEHPEPARIVFGPDGVELEVGG